MSIAEIYIGERTKTLEFRFQEMSRKRSVLYKGEDVRNGWHSLCLMLISLGFKIKCPTDLIRNFVKDNLIIDVKVSSEYINFVKNNIIPKIPQYPVNVRDLVTLMWIYPKKLGQFEPWISTDINMNGLEFDCSSFKFTQHSKGSALAFISHTVDIANEIWKNQNKWHNKLIEGNIYGFDKLKRLNTNSHITVLNSYIVSKYADVIEKLNEKYNNINENKDIILGNINHTFSETFAQYEICVVVSVECKIVDDYLKEFNKLTSQNLKPSKHITFGARFR